MICVMFYTKYPSIQYICPPIADRTDLLKTENQEKIIHEKYNIEQHIKH